MTNKQIETVVLVIIALITYDLVVKPLIPKQHHTKTSAV